MTRIALPLVSAAALAMIGVGIGLLWGLGLGLVVPGALVWAECFVASIWSLTRNGRQQTQ